MIRYLKSGQTAAAKAESSAQVRHTVEAILEDIQTNGMKRRCVGIPRSSISGRRASFRLSESEIEGCLEGVSSSASSTRIKFGADAAIRNFALVQKSALKDIEVETMPGVVLGQARTYR